MRCLLLEAVVLQSLCTPSMLLTGEIASQWGAVP